jgi:energy-coupling factor transporter ATP-binding protein EcfA2
LIPALSPIRITSIRFTRYKAFESFQVSLNDFNVLVGPNNAGKSTIIGSFRILAEGVRRARARKLEPIQLDGVGGWGYRISIGDLPIASENLFYGYDDSRPAEVVFRLSNGNQLKLHFPEQGTCYLIPESEHVIPRTTAQFKAHFDVEVGFVPILGPVEQHERLYEKEAARLALLAPNAARNFRNIWYHYPEQFEEFRALVSSTWPGMEINKPEIAGSGRELAMFCPEERLARELCWAGYGFQVWCQMLTYVVKARSASILVIDEPDIYLHSDLQRQLVALLRDLGPDILIATHSTEIVGDCEPTSLLVVNKKRKSAQRVKSASQLKNLFSTLGSNLNPTLTQLAKTRRALFLEGLDFQILAVFARKLGYVRVANRADFAVLQTQGFNPQRAVDLAAGIEQTVGEVVNRLVIYDRDYRSDNEVAETISALVANGFDAAIHGCKEIENYLLVPTVIGRAVESRLGEAARRSGNAKRPCPDISAMCAEICDELETDVFSQMQARELEYQKKRNKHFDQATITSQVMKRFKAEWGREATRLRLVGGKELLARLNTRLQEEVGVSISDLQVANEFQVDEIHQELRELLDRVHSFSKASSATANE